MKSGLSIALVDSGTLLAKDVKAVLTERGFPVGMLHRFHSGPPEAGLVTAEDDEATYVAPLAPDALEACSIAFLCGRREDTERFLATRLQDGCLAIDLSGVRRGAPLAVAGEPLPQGDLLLTPDPTAYVVADVLASLDRLGPVSAATVVVDRPVSELGKKALEELFQQAVALATFRSLPKEELGGQSAFNFCYPDDSDRYESRVAEDIVRLLKRALPITVLSARAGVFHGHHLRVEARFQGEAPPAAAISSALFGHRTVRDGATPSGFPPTPSAYENVDPENLSGPVESAGRDETLVLRVRSLDGSARIFMASDHLRRGGALHGVRLAEQAVSERGMLAASVS